MNRVVMDTEKQRPGAESGSFPVAKAAAADSLVSPQTIRVLELMEELTEAEREIVLTAASILWSTRQIEEGKDGGLLGLTRN